MSPFGNYTIQVNEMASKLTKLLKDLSDTGEAQESLGTKCLAFLVEKECWTADLAEIQFGIAYDDNGWSRTAGRPKDGTTANPAPVTVKNYISTFRRMYKFNLDIRQYKTMGELRSALKAARDAVKEEATTRPELKGVQLSRPNSLIGSLFHDIIASWELLPEDEQGAYAAKLQKIKDQMIKKAPADLRLVA
jgi:hypothetical protein